MQYLHDGDGLKVHFGTGNDQKEDYYFINIGDMRASTRTGLQIGGGENYWQTTGIDGASADTVVGGATDGYFGIEISTNDLDPSRDAGLERSWSMFRFMRVLEGDTIQDLADKINQGRGAQGTLNFSALGGTTVTGKSFDIGAVHRHLHHRRGCHRSAAAPSRWEWAPPVVSAATLANNVANAIAIEGFGDMGLMGVADGATVHMITWDGGTSGNLIELDVNGAHHLRPVHGGHYRQRRTPSPGARAREVWGFTPRRTWTWPPINMSCA